MRPGPDDRIDLHTHTTFSDGTCGVDELVQRARGAGLAAIGLTDHDTIAGWAEAPEAVRRHGVAVVPGIEVSTEYGHSSVHVLALLPDPSTDTALAHEILRARESRRTRARTMVDRLSADFPLTWELVAEQVAGETTTVGRPHIADALVAAGVVADRHEAFASMLAPSSPYYVRHYAPSPEAAVAAIRDCGGVAVAAHPASGSRGTAVPMGLLESMTAAGLAGIEVDHREHGAAERRRLAAFARAHGLLMTGGSDYHGRGKPNRLGENLTSPAVLEAMISLSSSGTEVLWP